MLPFQAGLIASSAGIVSVPRWSPLDLFPGVTNGGYYRADLGSNSVSQWSDVSGLDNHLTQGTGANQFILTTGVDGLACYRNETYDSDCYFNLPSISIDRRAHSWWCVARIRSCGLSNARTYTSFGPGLTDCMVCVFDASANLPPVIQTFGTGQQLSDHVSLESVALIIVNADSGALTFRHMGTDDSLTAYASGSVTGGRLFRRTDNYTINGEVYEFGLLDRILTSQEITDLEAYVQSRYGAWPDYGNLHVIGDSLTEGQGAVSFMNWPQIIDDNLRGDGWQVINEGAAAKTLAQYAAAAAKSAGGFRSGFTKNVAVCFAGTNDLGGGSNATTVLGSLNTWATAMQAAGYYTIACTIVARDDAAWSGAKETERDSYNSTLLGAPGTYHCDAAVDVAGIAELADPTDTTYFQADKIHLKDASYALIAALVQTAVLAA